MTVRCSPRPGAGRLVSSLETQVPPLIRQVIEQRLRRLSDETRYLLEIGSVVGHEVPFDHLAASLARQRGVSSACCRRGGARCTAF